MITLTINYKIEEDENLRSKIYEGYEDYLYHSKKNTFVSDSKSNLKKKRYFISLMSESLIKKGVFFRLQRRMRVNFNYNSLLYPKYLAESNRSRYSFFVFKTS